MDSFKSTIDNSTPSPVTYSPTIDLILGIGISFIIILTIIGNILVCAAVFLVRKLRKPCNYLLVSLAMSDMCVAILVMPMALIYEILGTWNFGPIICDIWVSLDVLSCTASILNICMISVDRYYAITKPLEYGAKRTHRRMIIYVLLVWLGAASISLPPLLILGNTHEGGRCLVSQDFGYQIYATLGSFFIPLTVMMFMYYKIYRAARKTVVKEKSFQSHLETNSDINIEDREELPDAKLAANMSTGSSPAVLTPANKKQHHRSSTSSTNMGSTMRTKRRQNAKVHPIAIGTSTKKFLSQLAKERKASVTLGIIMSAFIICWLPFFVLALIRPFLHSEDAIPRFVSSLSLWLGYANSLLNPIIYATLTRDFSTPFKQILLFRCDSLNHKVREEFYLSQYGDPEPQHQYCRDCQASGKLNESSL